MPRTPDPTKHTEILRQAKDLFMRQGFERTSMEAIAAAAGVSKPTLYRHFADKPALFRAVIRHVGGYVESRWPAYAPDEPLVDRLDRFAVSLHGLLFQPSSLAFVRLVIQEAGRDPVVGETYRELVDEPMTRHLRRAVAETGEVGRKETAAMAETFLALVRDPWFWSALTTGQIPTARKLAAVRRAALAGVRPLLAAS
ncbi:MAG: TetR/AcrR family transcriptional regulator [Planctomycetota bacterium]